MGYRVCVMKTERGRARVEDLSHLLQFGAR